MKREESGFKNRLGRLIKLAKTRAALAEIFGVSAPAITGWEGGSEPTDTTYEKISGRSGLSVNWLARGEGDEENELAKFAEWLEKRETKLSVSGARGTLREAREKAAMTYSELAKKIHRDASYLRALEEGSAPISENTAELIASVLPTISKYDLMEGSDAPKILSDGMRGTYGANSTLKLPPGMKGRYVPLLSLAEAGPWDADHSDSFYDYAGVFALNVDDRKAFAIQVSGNSMEPSLRHGDLVVCSPDKAISNRMAGVIKTKSDQVFVKYWKKVHDRVFLESANSAYKAIEFPLAEIAGAWPIVQHISSGMIQKKL